MELLNRSRPISKVLNDERTPPNLKELLGEVARVKAYGETFGLKATSNYVDYIDLDRAYVVWVVTASEKLKFKAKVWKFPIVGSFNYLGWFNEENALAYAEELSKEGLDIDVRGASAYSTLGWFKDPVLSTMIYLGKTRSDLNTETALGDLVNVVLHESVHATYYIDGQSEFNESLASFVADQLTVGYLKGRALEVYVKKDKFNRERRKIMHDAYNRLVELYTSALGDAQKSAKKAEIFEKLKADLKITRPMSNATLIQYRTYESGRSDFEALFAACAKQWACFWEKMNRIKAEDFSEDQMEDFGSVIQSKAMSSR